MNKSFSMSFLEQENINEVEVNVNPHTFDFIKEASLVRTGEELSDLNFDQAADLVGCVYVAIAKGDDTRATLHEAYVIDSKLDGKDAVIGHAKVKANELRPKIDDERTLVLNVLRSRKVWHAIIGRDPKIEHSLRFSNNDR